MGHSDCIFCQIINHKLPSEVVFESDVLLAIKDINPIAPVHILIIPKQHIPSILEADNPGLLADIQLLAATLARQLHLDAHGFRVVNNCGEWGGQTVSHLHYHLLGGKILGSMG